MPHNSEKDRLTRKMPSNRPVTMTICLHVEGYTISGVVFGVSDGGVSEASSRTMSEGAGLVASISTELTKFPQCASPKSVSTNVEVYCRELISNLVSNGGEDRLSITTPVKRL